MSTVAEDRDEGRGFVEVAWNSCCRSAYRADSLAFSKIIVPARFMY